jgi:ATP-dependent DNA helicase RecQ
MLDQAEEILREVWGYPRLRGPQRRVIVAAMSGRDTLAVLPTGGGKSLCFQIPALHRPGLTLVVSPLISLMQDQVAALRARGVGAAYLSSTQRPDTQRMIWDAALAGRLKLLYVAPERLAQVATRLRRGAVSLLAMDEAHCISEWGHDFRPHYRTVGRQRWALGRPPALAVTATATPDTRQDIKRVLGLRRPVEVVSSFDRPNLYFAVTRFREERARIEALTAELGRTEGATVVYVPTRDRTDGVAGILRFRGFRAAPYHAGLPGRARKALLQRFLDGRIRVMVATNAFGMGIDRSDVRLVAHLGVPPRPEAYFQEAGRAGRDGRPARCVMLWCDGDVRLARRMSSSGPATGGTGKALVTARRRGFQAMVRYVKTRGCRRRVLLKYLGEDLARCAGCDSRWCPPDASAVLISAHRDV